MKYLTKVITPIILLSLTLFSFGCKKEEITAAEWGERATAKRTEILNLSTNIPCSEKANTSIQTIQMDCAVQFYAIRTSDLEKYEKLKKEFLTLTNKQYTALTKEGLIVEPCSDLFWMTDQPIRLDCKDDKVYVITADNLPVDEAKSLITITKSQLDKLTAALNCTSDASLSYTRLINYQNMTMDYIPYAASSNNKELQAKASLYNRLNINVIKAEQKGNNFTNVKTVERVNCVNGKPVIKFRD
jgi:hypothetical protein